MVRYKLRASLVDSFPLLLLHSSYSLKWSPVVRLLFPDLCSAPMLLFVALIIVVFVCSLLANRTSSSLYIPGIHNLLRQLPKASNIQNDQTGGLQT